MVRLDVLIHAALHFGETFLTSRFEAFRLPFSIYIITTYCLVVEIKISTCHMLNYK